MIRNLVYSSADNSTIDVEMNHPEYGWIPFTASPDDIEQHGRDLYARAIAGDFGPIAPYVAPPPEPEPVPQVVTRAQGKAALIQAGLWQDVLDYVGSITDPTQKALAEVALHDTQEWRRDSPFLTQAAAAIGLTESQLDDLFRQATQIQL